MRKWNHQVYDEYVVGTSTAYIDPQWNETLGCVDQLALQATVDAVAGSGTITLTVAIEHSADNRNFTPKNATAEINAKTVSAGQTNVLLATDNGQIPFLPFVRLRIALGGTGPSAKVRIRATGRTGKVFRPTQLTGCVLWLRGDLGITQTSNLVSEWADQSGNGHNLVQATGANQPTWEPGGSAALNNQPLVRFYPSTNPTWLADGTGSDWVLGPGVTAAMVVATNSAAAANIFGKRYASLAYEFYAFASGQLVWMAMGTGAPNYAQINSGMDDGVGRSIIGTYASGAVPSHVMYVGGVAQTTTGQYTGNVSSTSDQNAVGAGIDSGGGDNQPFIGDIAELLLYDRTLSVSEVGQLSAYLKGRYGV